MNLTSIKTDMVDRAIAFAARAHKGQVRKYTDEPYISHPLAVMEIVSEVTQDETMLAAAVLHDVVEDTSISLDDIQYEFGYVVTYLVDQLTDRSTPKDGNRRDRKALDVERISKASDNAKTIKLADIIHNLSTIADADPKFARTYVAEKFQLLQVLGTGNAELYKRASALIENFILKGHVADVDRAVKETTERVRSETLGWMHAHACIAMDQKRDIREEEVPAIYDQCVADFAAAKQLNKESQP